MKAITPALIAIATAFSIGIANADEPRTEEVIIVTAPKPQPIDDREIELAVEAEPFIDFPSLTIEPPKLDRSAVGTERPVEIALGDAAKTKS